MNASGCGVTVKEYGHSLRHDPAYADKANRIADLTRDLSEIVEAWVTTPPTGIAALPRSPAVRGRAEAPKRVAFHSPCSLQHGQQLRGKVETILRAFGFDVQVAASEAHLCCGSAGTYSVLHPELAIPLRDRKLGHLAALEPQVIVSANIGCIQHLQSGTPLAVRHWVEVVDEALAAS